jgi:acyl-CoA reductase-like NAD-dependent aldehyde dehydrogenase
MLGKYADASMYVIRHNYTFKNQLHLLNEMYVNNRLPNLSIIINDIRVGAEYGQYHGYGGFGYTGYSNGYGTEYFDEKVESKAIFTRFLKGFGKS